MVAFSINGVLQAMGQFPAKPFGSGGKHSARTLLASPPFHKHSGCADEVFTTGALTLCKEVRRVMIQIREVINLLREVIHLL